MKVLKWLDAHFEETILIILGTVIAVVMMVNVIMRYVFQNSLTWADELTRYLLVWSTFMSISYCIRKGLSVQITMLRDALPGKGKYIMMLVVDVIMIALFVYMTPSAYNLLMAIIRMDAHSAAMQIPMSIIYVSPLIGFILTAIRSIQQIFFDFTAMKADTGNDK